MVSVSSLFAVGLALMATVSALPSDRVHALQKSEELARIIESGFTLQPRACRDPCCVNARTCCIAGGGNWVNGSCKY
ncbi:hypothetical protein BD560DRAFT_412049 [Blakeslea trispora]|nr:hypothetical protein BD560DRAFT_412049 [Blakeslea trispora]